MLYHILHIFSITLQGNMMNFWWFKWSKYRDGHRHLLCGRRCKLPSPQGLRAGFFLRCHRHRTRTARSWKTSGRGSCGKLWEMENPQFMNDFPIERYWHLHSVRGFSIAMSDYERVTRFANLHPMIQCSSCCFFHCFFFPKGSWECWSIADTVACALGTLAENYWNCCWWLLM